MEFPHFQLTVSNNLQCVTLTVGSSGTGRNGTDPDGDTAEACTTEQASMKDIIEARGMGHIMQQSLMEDIRQTAVRRPQQTSHLLGAPR